MENLKQIDLAALGTTLAENLSRYGLRALGAVALLILGWTAARLIRRSVRRMLERSRLDATLVPFVATLAYYAALTFVVVAVLGVFGIQTTSFIAVLGAVGFAVGLALQGTLGNFASGVMLIIFRPFQVGDYIEAGGAAGTVREIGVFSTRLHAPDNVAIIVPNSSVYGTLVKNYSANDTRRVDLVVGIDYSDDIGVAVATIQAVLGEDQRVLQDPAAVVAVNEMADSSVNLVVRPWCARADYWALRWDLTRRLKERLEAAGCSIPFPQRDVHLHRPEGAAS